MLDFKELPEDGQALELLTRELLFSMGHRVIWSGKGPDGGKDLICEEELPSIFRKEKRRWLVQCKHKAHSGKSVGVGDLDNVVDSCAQHEAHGYLLVCSTHPSSGVSNRLEGISKKLPVVCWDAIQIERHLSTPRQWPIAQRFFQKSAVDWKIYATERPNQWIANHRGYYFHLSNRIGSSSEFHVPSIAQRIVEVEAIKLPANHQLRLRAIYFNDKSSVYTWYLDYMRPRGSKPSRPMAELKRILGDGDCWQDGCGYNFDILPVEYRGYSDHFDLDHYQYYSAYISQFHWGGVREQGAGVNC